MNKTVKAILMFIGAILVLMLLFVAYSVYIVS